VSTLDTLALAPCWTFHQRQRCFQSNTHRIRRAWRKRHCPLGESGSGMRLETL